MWADARQPRLGQPRGGLRPVLARRARRAAPVPLRARGRRLGDPLGQLGDPGRPRQLAWLRGRAAGGGDCRLVFWHRPRFNAGRAPRPGAEGRPLWDAIEGRAAIVLHGHDHDMQRFKPVKGTTEYVSGAGGKSHYPVDASDPRLAFSDDQYVRSPPHRAHARQGRAALRRRRRHRRSTAAPSPARADRSAARRYARVRPGGRSSVGRAPGCGPGGRGFESRRSPSSSLQMTIFCAAVDRARGTRGEDPGPPNPLVSPVAVASTAL